VVVLASILGGAAGGAIDSLVVTTLSMRAGDTIKLTFERQGASHPASLTLAQGG
jgi:hypothetical protein